MRNFFSLETFENSSTVQGRKFQEILVVLSVILSGRKDLFDVSGESEIVLIITKSPLGAEVEILPSVDSHLLDALAKRTDSISNSLETLVSLTVCQDGVGNGLFEIGSTHDHHIIS